MNEYSFIFAFHMRTRDTNKERAIRDQALKTIVKNGFDGLSMQKLAKAAAVSPATIYIYFKDREDLILQLFAEASKKMTEATLKDFDPAMSFSEGLKVQWMNRARYCIANPDEMYFLEQIRHSPLQEKSLQMMGSGFKDIMKDFVSNAIKRKELVKVPLEVYWSVAFAPLYTLVQFHIAGTSIGGNKFKFSEKIMLETLALVVKALKP
jgi:TetR/AcrR family transcriptional regulator, multidrug resistance operon repressor